MLKGRKKRKGGVKEEGKEEVIVGGREGKGGGGWKIGEWKGEEEVWVDAWNRKWEGIEDKERMRMLWKWKREMRRNTQ